MQLLPMLTQFPTAPPGGKSSHQKTAHKHPKAALLTCFAEDNHYHSGYYRALPLLQMSYQQHGRPPQSLLPLHGGMEKLAVTEKEYKTQYAPTHT